MFLLLITNKELPAGRPGPPICHMRAVAWACRLAHVPSSLPHVCELPCVRSMTFVAIGPHSPCSYTFRLSAAAFQPHDARFFSRGSMQGSNCSRLGPIRLSTLNVYYIDTPLPLSGSCLYNVTVALNCPKWILNIPCQCIRYREEACAQVQFHLRNVVTGSKHGYSNGGFKVGLSPVA
jgi:hypothetical protein